MAVATLTFADRLAAEVERKRSQLVVGLDPQPDLLPGRAARRRRALLLRHRRRGRAARGRGQAAARVLRGARAPRAWPRSPRSATTPGAPGLLVIADGKRGDIGSTARAYAAAYLEGDEPVADALTVNPYLGRESIEPYLAAARRYGTGIFCVVKTSNAGGDMQDVTLSDGRPLWHHVADARRGVGRGSRRRARALRGRRRRRRDTPARRRRSAQADAAGRAAAARRRRAGREARPTRPRVHERPGERARQRVALGQLRLPRDRRGLPTAAGAEAARLRNEIWAVSGW